MLNTEKDLNKYTPAYEPLSLREPTEGERKIDITLKAYMDTEMKLESIEEGERRNAILAEVKNIFVKWVQFIAIEVLHMPSEEAEDGGGELFISGSHRLGVRDIGADIDTVCVAPNFCTREHFFTYLKNDLINRSEVTEMIAIEEAFVPIMSFDFRGVNIDLLFARLADNSVPKDIDILDDRILIGLDEATEKSLNGPRVTNMIYKLVGEKTFPNFLIVLRCIRRWAKKRGIYGNKLGYLGGINCNIMVAFICQLYPNSSPSSLLFRFYKLYYEWKWPEPIMLNNIQPNPPGCLLTDERVIWSPKNNSREFMPLITPAYPAMNSAFNVSSHSFEIMKSEIKRAHELRDIIVKEKKWEKLFEPSDFFIKYSHYLVCHIVGTGDNPESRSWAGFVESRIRRFIQYPYLETLPILHPIHLYPIVSKTTKSSYSICYFIGFNLDLDTIHQRDDKNIHIDDCAFRFQESLFDPERGYKGERIEGLDFFVEHLKWSKLPKEVFETIGGYEIAKELRNKYKILNVPTPIVEAPVLNNATIPATTNDENKDNIINENTNINEQKNENIIKNEIKNQFNTSAINNQKINYTLGKRYFPQEIYEDMGSTTVDTIENYRNKLKINNNIIDNDTKIIILNTRNKKSNSYNLKLEDKMKIENENNQEIPTKQSTMIPNVTWHLLDTK